MSEFGNQSKSYLSELVRLNKYNLIACGYQKLTVNGTAASLTVPAGAKYAEMTFESSVTSGVIARHLELGAASLPTSADGLGITHLLTFDITGYPNLINFRVIQTGAGTHTLHIQYYK